MTTTAAQRAEALRRLHTDPELLVLVNAWDAASATVIAGQPGCRAVATASYSIAAAHGYPDGEQLPFALMLATLERIVAAVALPVSADLEAGYGDVGATVRAVIGVGVVGGNLEDELRPLAESVAAVEAAVRAGASEGVPFVLNARTDAFLLAGQRDPGAVLAEAVVRGRAFLDAGADCVFVPGVTSESLITALVDGIGSGRVSLMVSPGAPPLARLAELGVARVSYGPWTQRVALTALADAAAQLLAGGALPAETRAVI
ncbi:MAG: isocitrate lyase/PEP mutase family protein [Jatrophihabitans sp.]